MDALLFTHNTPLGMMARLVAGVAGFTGLSLTRSLSEPPVFEKKASIAPAL